MTGEIVITEDGPTQPVNVELSEETTAVIRVDLSIIIDAGLYQQEFVDALNSGDLGRIIPQIKDLVAERLELGYEHDGLAGDIDSVTILEVRQDG